MTAETAIALNDVNDPTFQADLHRGMRAAIEAKTGAPCTLSDAELDEIAGGNTIANSTTIGGGAAVVGAAAAGVTGAALGTAAAVGAGVGLAFGAGWVVGTWIYENVIS